MLCVRGICAQIRPQDWTQREIWIKNTFSDAFVVTGLFGYRLEPCQDMFSFSSIPLLGPWWLVCWHSLSFSFGDRAREMKNDGAIGSEIRLPDLPDLNLEARGICNVHRNPYRMFAHFSRQRG